MKIETIDLPVESQGMRCTLCEAAGGVKLAALLHREQGPTCYVCFAELLNVEMRLRILQKKEGV